MYAYLDNVERVVRAGLLTMDPTWTGDRAHLGVGIARAIAAINVFESSIPAEEGKSPTPLLRGRLGGLWPAWQAYPGAYESSILGQGLRVGPPDALAPDALAPDALAPVALVSGAYTSAPRGTLHGVVSPRVPKAPDSKASSGTRCARRSARASFRESQLSASQ